MAIIYYVACVVCGKTVVANKFRSEPFRIDPLDYMILQAREQRGGRSKTEGEQPGFFIVEGESRTIKELWESDDPKERAIAETFKERVLSIVRAYGKAGIIRKEELEGTV